MLYIYIIIHMRGVNTINWSAENKPIKVTYWYS